MGILGVTPFLNPYSSAGNGASVPLDVLVLGGTNFVGPAVVMGMLQAGHRVTIFNRGMTNPTLFPELTKIKGDRSKGMAGYNSLAKEKKSWDVVIDVWPQNPHYVEDAIGVLKGRTSHYMYISSVAVYDNYVSAGIIETSSLRNATTYVEGHYNENKVLCEQVVAQNFPISHTIVRPGAIVGDRDPGPFGVHLLHRIMKRDKILAPDSNDPVQFIDAADIGGFLTLCAEKKTFGIFNLVGPSEELGYKDMMLTCREALRSKVEIVWMDPKFITETVKLQPFSDIPFWIPAKTDPDPGFYQISNTKARKAGLRFTDLSHTARVSYDSVMNINFIREEESDSYFGLDAMQEEKALRLWKQQR